jgi:hypothetical protein
MTLSTMKRNTIQFRTTIFSTITLGITICIRMSFTISKLVTRGSITTPSIMKLSMTIHSLMTNISIKLSIITPIIITPSITTKQLMSDTQCNTYATQSATLFIAILSVVILSVVMLSIVMLSVIMLFVVAPLKQE